MNFPDRAKGCQALSLGEKDTAPPLLKPARLALCTASVLFQLLPTPLMDYGAGWGSRRNPGGVMTVPTAPPSLSGFRERQ
jgi:hypothetical protein